MVVQKNLDDILYLNLSESIDHTMDDGMSFEDTFNDFRHIDKFSGFFFNLRNITKIEIENFLMFYGADVLMLNDKVFMKNVIIFFSLFINEAFISYFMTMVTVSELYLLFNTDLYNKSVLNKLMINFNKSVRVEIYRFFVTCRIKNKFMNYKRFKLMVVSNAFFFDDKDILYHYFTFAQKKMFDGDTVSRKDHRVNYDLFLRDKINFLDIIYLKVDNLIYNLYTLNQVLRSYDLSYNVNKIAFSYYEKRNLDIKKRDIKLPYKLRFNLYLNSLVSYFMFLHEIISFFRYYVYIFYFLSYKQISLTLKMKYLKQFKLKFNEMIIFYKNYHNKFFLLMSDSIFALYNYVRKYIYMYFVDNNKNKFFKFFFKFQFLLLKFFNLFKLMLLKNKMSFDSHDLVLTFNSFIFNKLKTMVTINNFDELINMFQYKNIININNKDNDLNNLNIVNSVLSNNKMPYSFKLFFCLFNNNLFYNKTFIFGLLNNYLKYFCNFFTMRTFYYYDNLNLMELNNEFSVFNNNIKLTRLWLVNLLNGFKINNLITNFIMLYSTVTTFMQFKDVAKIFPIKIKSLFLPHRFRINAVIDDFFFLLAEEFFGEDFMFFYDDEITTELDLGDRGDAEDEEDYFDETFDNETDLDGHDESEDFYMFTYIDELISINYYIHDNVLFKYNNLNTLTEKKPKGIGDWFCDYDNSKLSPYYDRKFIMFGGDRTLAHIDHNSWYEWISAFLIADLGSFSAGIENVNTAVPLSHFRFINKYVYHDFGKAPLIEDEEYANMVVEGYRHKPLPPLKYPSITETGYYPNDITLAKTWGKLPFTLLDVGKDRKVEQFIDLQLEVANYIDYLIDREIFSETGILAGSSFYPEIDYTKVKNDSVFHMVQNFLKKNFYKYKRIKHDSLLHMIQDVDLTVYPDEINDQNLFDDYGITDYDTYRFEHFYENRTDEVYYKFYEEVDSFVGFTETLVSHDFMLLQETWVWWNCINKVYSNNDLLKHNKTLKPNNKQELIFFNTLVLSGLGGALYETINTEIQRNLEKERIREKKVKTEEEKEIEEEPFKRFYVVFEKLLKDYDISSGLHENKNKKDSGILFNTFESYYNNWLNKHTHFLFDTDYRELVSFAFMYNEFVLGDNLVKEDGLHPSLFFYLKKLENAYINMVTNTYKSLMLSYYSTKQENYLLYFWHQIINVLLDNYYGELEGEQEEDILDLEEHEMPQVNHYIKSMLTDYENVELERLTDPFEIGKEGRSLLVGDYFAEFPNQMMDPYYLIAKGLNVNYSVAESAIFDIYESYLDILVDSTVDSFDFSEQIQQYRFFEDEDFYLRNYGFFEEEPEDSISQQYREAYLEWGYEYNEDRVAYETMEFGHNYIGEASDLYVERLKSIKGANMYLFSLFETYVKCSSFQSYVKLLDEENVFNMNAFKILDLTQVKINFDIRNLSDYKLQLSYYYILNLLNLSKYFNFNIYILRLFYFVFLNFFKKFKIPLNHHFFFLIFFSGYFLYLIVFFFKKHYNYIIIKLSELFQYLEKLSVHKLYELISFLFKKLYRYFYEYIKTLCSFFYKNYVFKKYFFLYKQIYKKNLYKLLFKLFSFIGNSTYNDRLSVVDRGYCNNVSLRSFLSTLNIYELSAKNKLVLYNNLLSLDYFKGNPLNLLRLHNFVDDSTKLEYGGKGLLSNYLDDKLYNSVNMLEDIGYIESCFFDFYEALSDTNYFDFENAGTDDWGFYTDEWSGSMEIGDQTDDYDDEGLDDIENQGDEDEFVTSEEEFSSELSLDSMFAYWYIDDNNFAELDTDEHELWDYEKHLYIQPWAHRVIFVENKFFSILDLYRRTFMLHLFNIYKSIPVTTGFKLSDIVEKSLDQFRTDIRPRSFRPDISTIEDEPEPHAVPIGFVHESPFKKLKKLYKSKALKKKFNKIKYGYSGNEGENYDVLIPKFVYLLEPIDYLDYYLDYNSEDEFAEFNSYFDNFDVFNGFSSELFKFSMSKNNSDLAVLRLMNFFSFSYLYIYIYSYIDTKYLKFFYFSFFFFNFNILYSKYIKKYYVLVKNYNINFKLFIKYVYDRLYIYLYKQLFNFNLFLVKYKQKVNYEEDIFYKEYKIFINLFVGKNYKLVSLIFFDFSFFVKKFFILKSIFGSRLTNLSYIFLLKAIEWFLVVNTVVKKNDLIRFVNFILKRLYMFEYFVFFNAYKLAQIYARYGLMESFYFFQKNIQLVSIDKALQHVNKKYTHIDKIIFIYEFIIFIFCFLVFFVSTMNFITDFTLLLESRIAGAHYLEHLDVHRPTASPARAELSTDYQLAGDFHRMMYDVWGIF